MPFDGTQLSPTTQALIEGRRRIEAGWCQKTMRTREGVCAVAAVSHCPDAVTTTLQKALGRWNIAAWNDEPDRTKQDVLALYDRAIAISLNSFQMELIR